MTHNSEPHASLNLDDLPALPHGWKWCSAYEACSTIASGSTPPASRMYSGQGQVPFIKVYNLTDHGVLDFSVRPTFIDRDTHDGHLSRSRVYAGDVLINIVGPPLGKVALVPRDYPEWNITQAVVLFRPWQGVNNRYVAYALLTNSIMSCVTTRAKASAGQFNIGVNRCRHLLPLRHW